MNIVELLLIGFATVSGLLSLYYLVFLRFGFIKETSSKVKPDFPVSVIVVGRNEAENFKKNLPKLCKQNYPQFEVVAVNDQSIDNSKEVIEELQKTYSNLKLVDVKENDRFWLGKKYGLTLGIKAAQYEQLLLTDADCFPNSDDWISTMVGPMLKGKALVLGYGKYELNKSLINLFIQFETVHTATQYFSWAMLGMPYMGVGRNMAYHRQLFFDNKGFVNHMHIPSGDDDLFVQKAAVKKNTSIVFNKEAHTISEPKNSFKDWILQKQRHYKTSKHYKPLHKIVLGLYGMLQPLFYVGLTAMLLFTDLYKEIAIIAGVKLFLQYLSFTLACIKLRSYRILWGLPFLELSTWVFQLTALIGGRLNKKSGW